MFVQNLVVGDIMSWMENVGVWGIGAVALFVGLALIIRGLLDIRKGAGGASKEPATIAMGVGIMVLGGILGWWGGSQIRDFAKGLGTQVPKN